MTRAELLRRKRFPRWLVGLFVAFAAFSGVACEADVEGGGEVEGEEGGEGEGEGEGGEGVDTDVDVDTDTEDGDG